jgi:hypothetical protein
VIRRDSASSTQLSYGRGRLQASGLLANHPQSLRIISACCGRAIVCHEVSHYAATAPQRHSATGRSATPTFYQSWRSCQGVPPSASLCRHTLPRSQAPPHAPPCGRAIACHLVSHYAATPPLRQRVYPFPGCFDRVPSPIAIQRSFSCRPVLGNITEIHQFICEDTDRRST